MPLGQQQQGLWQRQGEEQEQEGEAGSKQSLEPPAPAAAKPVLGALVKKGPRGCNLTPHRPMQPTNHQLDRLDLEYT